MLSNSYYNTYLAKLNYLRVKNKYNELIQLFKKALITSSIFNIVAFTIFILLGNWFLGIIGADYKLLSLLPLLIIKSSKGIVPLILTYLANVLELGL